MIAVMWLIVKCVNKKATLLMVIVFLINQSALPIFSYANNLPEAFHRKDFKEEEYKTYVAIIIAQAINYNSFGISAILFPLIVLPLLYL